MISAGGILNLYRKGKTQMPMFQIFGKLLILITEDDEEERKFLVKALKPVSSEITESHSGKETLQKLADNVYDCLIIDYKLPDYDGLQLVKDIRRIGVGCPIVVVTDHGNEVVAVELLKAGAQDYLIKSKITANLLSQTVINAVRLKNEADLIEYYKRFYDQAPVGFMNYHVDECVVTRLNKRIVELVGYTPEELATPKNILNIFNKEDYLKILKLIGQTGFIDAMEVKIKAKDGTFKWVMLSARTCTCYLHGNCPLKGKHCKAYLKCIEIAMLDITEKKQVEEELEEMKRVQMDELRSLRSDMIKRFDLAPL